MDLRENPAEAAFRAEVAGWLDEVLPTLPPPPPPDDWPARRAYDTHWQRLQFDAGYAGIHWPKEYGGRGASPNEHLIFLEETLSRGAPVEGANFVGLLHGGPTLIAEATPEQQARHLPGILKGDHIWCQGFSEPGAGSDLASLRTRAVRDGDDYVVTGQKIWTSYAHVADFCELLVRTDPDAPKHKGITWLILPMDTPGVEVRPLTTIYGSAEFAELFLDEVRIPVANRVGEENDGWRVAMVTFSFERGTALVGEFLQARKLLVDLGQRARAAGLDGDAGLRREFGHLAADMDALWALTKRNVSRAARHGVPNPGAAAAWKLHFTEVYHRLGALTMRVLGPDGFEIEDPHVHGQLFAISMSIAAGTSQVQRNILGERVLGLPKT